MNMIQQFQQFAKSMTPAGAKAKVKELLSNGQMSKEQFEELKSQAQNIMSMLGR